MPADFPPFDLYEELGVSPRASARIIEAAWRALAKEFHPDVATDLRAAEAKIKRINAAHDVLANAEARAEYDAQVAEQDAGSARARANDTGRTDHGWSPQPEPATRGALRCPKCRRQFADVGPLQWHRSNVEACW